MMVVDIWRPFCTIVLVFAYYKELRIHNVVDNIILGYSSN